VLGDTCCYGGDTDIAIGVDGFPVIASFYTKPSEPSGLVVAHCLSSSCSLFDPPSVLFNTSGAGKSVSIAIGVDNFPIITYLNISPTSISIVMIVHCTSPSCKTYDTPLSVSLGSSTTMAIQPNGLPIIVFVTTGTVPTLAALGCFSPNCSIFGFPIFSVQFVGSTSVVIGWDGFPIISYRDTLSDELRVVHCTTSNCGSHVVMKAAGLIGGWYNSITIGSDGLPIISYANKVIGGQLLVAHCLYRNCSLFESPPNYLGVVYAVDTSIAIGTDGFPIISYYNPEIAEGLLVVHCTSINCSSYDPRVHLDPTDNDAGSHSSIVIGKDGLPIISYVIGKPQFVGIMHCKGGLFFLFSNFIFIYIFGELVTQSSS